MTKRTVLTILLNLLFIPITAFPMNAGMVVSENKLASQAGIEILRAGGNAIDAAVAVGYALTVVTPCCGSLGGGGFMVIHLANGKNIALNFREKAPLKATETMFINHQNAQSPDATTTGYLAVAVPGTVLGLDTALNQYGTLPRSKIMAPAIKLAEDGYTITPYQLNLFNQYAHDFRSQTNVSAIFLKNGTPYQLGDRLKQEDLAKTLKLIAKEGANAFYNGPIAKQIVAASNANGGLLTRKDFATYTVVESPPIYCQYHNYLIVTTPPPSGGVVLCDMLKQVQHISLKSFQYHSLQSTEAIINAMGKGFEKRNQNVAPTKNAHFRRELTDTTHYSVIDKEGNAVSVTYTINGFFGARVIADHTGFFLNNEMDDFTTHPGKPNKFNLIQPAGNDIEPGKRPWSSMAPTLVMKNGKIFMVLGGPGGPRIITSIFLTLLNILDYDMSLQAAINAPRIHYQSIPNVINMEPNALPANVIKKVTQLGRKMEVQHPWGAIEAIQIDQESGKVYGANDYRRPDGAALAY